MRAVVVYESLFGNTKAVAKAVGEGLSSRGVAVEVTEVSEAPRTPDGDLLVVGGPTHAFGLTRGSTRSQAERQGHGEVVTPGTGLREWLDRLSPGSGLAAAFDTHLRSRLPGSAAGGAERRLRRLGYRIAVPAESFFVADVEGPLQAGERERAREWGADLADRSLAASRSAHPT